MSGDDKAITDAEIVSRILGSKDLQPEKEESLEEIKTALTDLGIDLDELNQHMEAIKLKLAGRLAIKRAAEARGVEGEQIRSVECPPSRDGLINEIRSMEESVGYAARQTDTMTDNDLRAYHEGLAELRDLDDTEKCR